MTWPGRRRRRANGKDAEVGVGNEIFYGSLAQGIFYPLANSFPFYMPKQYKAHIALSLPFPHPAEEILYEYIDFSSYFLFQASPSSIHSEPFMVRLL
jgi:hypothetical protein